jgi:DNA-binding transcriptional regulator YhcF (GntR family)
MEYRSTLPIYLQIADIICEEILTKSWTGGARIPSVRELAVQYEVNPNTVMRPFTSLQDSGIIYTQRGIGYFVSDDAYERTLELKRGEFRRNEIPYFVKMVNLLQIPFDEIMGYFKAPTGEMA